jgi:hypothetical protein
MLCRPDWIACNAGHEDSIRQEAELRPGARLGADDRWRLSLQKEVRAFSRLSSSSGGEEKKEEGKNQMAHAIVSPAEMRVSSLRDIYRKA